MTKSIYFTPVLTLIACAAATDSPVHPVTPSSNSIKSVQDKKERDSPIRLYFNILLIKTNYFLLLLFILLIWF